MKTTIKTHTDDVVVKPSPITSLIELHIETPIVDGGHRASVVLTRDQAEALVFGIESALECASPLPLMSELERA